MSRFRSTTEICDHKGVRGMRDMCYTLPHDPRAIYPRAAGTIAHRHPRLFASHIPYWYLRDAVVCRFFEEEQNRKAAAGGGGGWTRSDDFSAVPSKEDWYANDGRTA